MDDLISRSALKDVLSKERNRWKHEGSYQIGICHGLSVAKSMLENAPAVDAIVLPKGRPGDYLEWETGIIDHTTIQPIKAILICEDCVRYDLGVFAPTVDHENIVRIMSREEAGREIERRENDGK